LTKIPIRHAQDQTPLKLDGRYHLHQPSTGMTAISVVVVSDYSSDAVRKQSYLQECLQGLADQKPPVEAEFILVRVTNDSTHSTRPLTDILSNLRILDAPKSTSFQAKNVGARAARAPLIAFIDADCRPAKTWLAEIVRVMGINPGVTALNGKTVYSESEFLPRACCLIGRAYLDTGVAAPVGHISNHNFAIRREAYRVCPLPENATPFSGTLYATRLLAAGFELIFDPSVCVIHAYNGWKAECDIRRNRGYAEIRDRLAHPELPRAGQAHLGYLSIPLMLLASFVRTCLTCVRRFDSYRIAWFELPAVWCVAAVLHLADLPGMLDAVRKRPLRNTAYH